MNERAIGKVEEEYLTACSRSFGGNHVLWYCNVDGTDQSYQPVKISFRRLRPLKASDGLGRSTVLDHGQFDALGRI
jgi:hypothetical protein